MFEISGLSLGATKDIKLQIVSQFRTYTRDKLIVVLLRSLYKLNGTTVNNHLDINNMVLPVVN